MQTHYLSLHSKKKTSELNQKDTLYRKITFYKDIQNSIGCMEP